MLDTGDILKTYTSLMFEGLGFAPYVFPTSRGQLGNTFTVHLFITYF